MENSKNHTITPITGEEVKRYDNNLQILQGESFFDERTKSITIKFPVSNKNFEPVRAYDISSEKASAVLYAISDGTDIAVKDSAMKFMFEQTFGLDVLNGSQVNNGKLMIIVYNDNVDFVSDADLKVQREFVETHGDLAAALLCKEKTRKSADGYRPKEACGGIIVRR